MVMASSAQAPIVPIAPESAEALRALYQRDLRHRRVFVPGRFQLAERQGCLLVVGHPGGSEFAVLAEAVYIKLEEPGIGVGLELSGLDAERLGALEAFVNQSLESSEPGKQRSSDQAPKNVQERIRKLSLREREVVARQGTQAERVVLERTFGSSVWETLLQNPQLSVPEVAHIARNGAVPIPLIALVVANSGWLASGEVRRALLSNPRASGAHLERVLRATPRTELKQIAQASPFRSEVRAAAKRLIGG